MVMDPCERRSITMKVNGVVRDATVECRRTLLDCLRDDLSLHGTHVGCEHGVCGCCNVLVDGDVVRSCLMLAAQADGATITTVEGLAGESGLSPMQQAFYDHHALQCGYCTPGILIAAEDLLKRDEAPSEAELEEALSGNLCRCTGYQQILDAMRDVTRPVQEPTAMTGTAPQ